MTEWAIWLAASPESNHEDVDSWNNSVIDVPVLVFPRISVFGEG